MSIAAEIRAEMARRNIGTSTLAETLGLKRSYLSLRLNEHREFVYSEIKAIGDILKVPAWQLAQRAEENTPPALAASSSSPSNTSEVAR